jgi:hypothetical protein
LEFAGSGFRDGSLVVVVLRDEVCDEVCDETFMMVLVIVPCTVNEKADQNGSLKMKRDAEKQCLK